MSAAPLRRARTPTASGQQTRAAIRREATTLFRQKGYDAASMRDIAAAVGIEAASVYNHYPSKQVLLSDLLLSVMEELVGDLRAAVEATADRSPADQLRALVATYVRIHESRLDEAFITDTERRSLDAADHHRLLALRGDLSAIFRAALQRGVDTGDFVVEDVGVANLAILSMCSRLAVWYRPDGRLGLDDVAAMLGNLALRAVGVEPAR